MALFEGYERRIDKINEVLNSYGISSIEEAKTLCDDLGVDVYNIVKGIQMPQETDCLHLFTRVSFTRACGALSALSHGESRKTNLNDDGVCLPFIRSKQFVRSILKGSML